MREFGTDQRKGVALQYRMAEEGYETSAYEGRRQFLFINFYSYVKNALLN